MNRLRSIAIEEQRELTTFALAVAVFLLTLLALQVRDRGPASDGGAGRAGGNRMVMQLAGSAGR